MKTNGKYTAGDKERRGRDRDTGKGEGWKGEREGGERESGTDKCCYHSNSELCHMITASLTEI